MFSQGGTYVRDLTQILPFDVSEYQKVVANEFSMNANGPEKRGVVFTRTEVVEFILDLVGYAADLPLHKRRILEPSFGNGSFLLRIIDRLLASWNSLKQTAPDIYGDLSGAIRAVELDEKSFEETRSTVMRRLKDGDIPSPTALRLVDAWLIRGDFLLENLDGHCDYVVGNPPYVRQEHIPYHLMIEYKRRFKTIFDRADLYIPFIERSLSLLAKGGVLGFICSDRWMKNRYGGPLREFISVGYHLKAYVDMVDTDAFHSDVSAYPAITIISRSTPGATRIAHRPDVDANKLALVSKELLAEDISKGSSVREIVGVLNGAEPWLLDSSDQRKLIRRIEDRYPLLEQTGCRVGIGVATGADKVFIGDFESLDVEADRKLPLVGTIDIRSGEILWKGRGVINPFREDGSLVDLNDYPKLERYLNRHKDLISGRHCAQRAPLNWYRTIDRIWPELTYVPKLLIPDIKGEANVVFESGKFYPHHNIYYILSENWSLKALQAVLLSSITRLFITTYSTKMRGGYLRFQAQYLRRIRVPYWRDAPDHIRKKLIEAVNKHDIGLCNEATFDLYNLNEEERAIVGGK